MKRKTKTRASVGFILLAIFAATILAQSGCRENTRRIGVRLKKTSQFENEIKRYHDFAPHKAIAVAGDVWGAYAIGYAVEAASQREAVSEALDECDKHRSERRIADDCRLHAIDDDIIGEDEDHPTAEDRE
jgi:hypothetical protein